MTRPNRLRALIGVGCLLAVWAGCREDNPVGEDANKPPETFLVQAPDSAQTGFYLNHLFWEGYDLDGRVEYFEVAVTDSYGVFDETVSWHPTYRTDSLVRFPVGGEEGQFQVLGHRFYVRAVDNQDRRDPTPAWVFFGAKDLAPPEVDFTVARGFNPNWPEPGNPDTVQIGAPIPGNPIPPDTMPSNATVEFTWRGVDRDSVFGRQIGFVTQFEHKLVAPENSDVGENTFVGGTLADTMARYENLDQGTYTLIVKAVDDAGLNTTPAARRLFHVNFDPWARIEQAFYAPVGDSVPVFQISDKRVSSTNVCRDYDLLDWAPTQLPPAPVNPDLPAGFLMSDDTLATGPDFQEGWWVKLHGRFADPDGMVQSVEVNRMVCLGRNCSAVPWDCAAIDVDNTVYVGPFTSGDYRIVLAAVDTLGQRGAAGADTIDLHVDLAPYVVPRTDGQRAAGCDCFAASEGDTLRFCDNDTLYVVEGGGTQSNQSETPCAVRLVYATGGRAPVSVSNMQSFPQPGDVIELEFGDTPPDTHATLCCIVWAYDPDGHHRVGYARWNLDNPVPENRTWLLTTHRRTFPPPGDTLTPVCFKLIIPRPGDHELFVQVRDWLQSDYAASDPVAQRSAGQRIPFTVLDAGEQRRKQLPGRNGS